MNTKSAVKKSITVPKKVLEIPNVEKKNHEVWTPGRDLFDFPKPYRWLITGAPNSGKTSLILNHLLHCNAPQSKSKFDKIFLLHPRNFTPGVSDDQLEKNEGVIVSNPDLPPEYEGVECIHLAYLPSEKFWSAMNPKHRLKMLLIVDDIDLSSLVKRSLSRQRIVNKTVSYSSTHSNLSIIVTSQSPSTQLPPIVLQMCNIVTLYPITDKYKVYVLATKLSIDSKLLFEYLKLLKGMHDTLTLDMTLNTPMPLRINIYEPVEVKSEEALDQSVGSTL